MSIVACAVRSGGRVHVGGHGVCGHEASVCCGERTTPNSDHSQLRNGTCNVMVGGREQTKLYLGSARGKLGRLGPWASLSGGEGNIADSRCGGSGVLACPEGRSLCALELIRRRKEQRRTRNGSPERRTLKIAHAFGSCAAALLTARQQTPQRVCMPRRHRPIPPQRGKRGGQENDTAWAPLLALGKAKFSQRRGAEVRARSNGRCRCAHEREERRYNMP